MKELDQLLDKLGILLKTGINLELFIRHLRKHLKKEHAKTDIIERLLLVTFIECKIACHLSKARNGDGKRSLLVYELQDFVLLLKRQGVGRDIKDPLPFFNQAISFIHQDLG